MFNDIAYEPHVQQLAFHDDDSRFKLLIAGARFGKSLASARDTLSDLLAGNTRGWLVGPTYALTRPEFRYIRDDMLHASDITEYSNHPPALTTRWGGEVVCMSARLPEALLGEEIDWLILCEGAHLDREAFDRFLRARLVTRNGRLLVPTTPRGHNWIYELYEGASKLEEWRVQRAATWDNPHVDEEEINAARRSLPQATFAEQFGGEFVTPHGRVYEEFDYELHVAPGLTPPPGAILHKGIDFGYVAPFACLWGYLDADDVLHIVHEYYRPERAMPLHIRSMREIDDRFRAMGCRMGAAYVDPSGAEQRNMLAQEGLHVLPANNHVEGGIEVVRRRLIPNAQGRAGLRIDASCMNLLREIDGYAWQDNARAPGKGSDHALDALRYLCVALTRRVGWKPPGVVW